MQAAFLLSALALLALSSPVVIAGGLEQQVIVLDTNDSWTWPEVLGAIGALGTGVAALWAVILSRRHM